MHNDTTASSIFFFSSRRRHTRFKCDWSSDVCSSDLWTRLHKHFTEPELVEIGYFIALTMGQQRWLRTLGIEHHQILAGTDASMAPGFESAEPIAPSNHAPASRTNRTIKPQPPH